MLMRRGKGIGMTETIGQLFDKRITVGNILTIVAMAVGGFWVVAELRANDRLTDQRMAQLERKQDQIESLARSIADMQGDIRYLRQIIERRATP